MHPEPPPLVIVPFDPELDLILVEVELRGPRRAGQFTFALDTGCSETLVTPEAIDEIGFSPRDGDSITSVTTALSREHGYRLRLGSLFALGHRTRNFRVNVHDLPDNCGLAGLLGLNFLRQFNYEIRSGEGRIHVTPL